MLKNVATLGVKRALLLSITVAVAIAGPATAFFVTREVRHALENAVRLGLSGAELQERIHEVGNVVLAVLAFGGALLVVLVYSFVSRLILRPLVAMSAVAQRVSECDLTARAGQAGDDEIGNLAQSLNRIGENLTVTLSRVQNVTGGVAAVIERISRTGAAVSSGTGTVTARVVDTSSSMGQMIAWPRTSRRSPRASRRRPLRSSR
jgi:methyl-accepting chemotaxis protein